MSIDLHIHTNVSSDGELSAYEIVKLAGAIGLKTISLTDHDSVAAVKEGLYWGEQNGVEVIPGCEFFTQHQGRFLHILGYFINPEDPALLELSQEVEIDRIMRIDLQIKKLREGGFYLEREDVLRECNNTLPLYSSYARVIFSDPRNRENPLVKEYRDKPSYIVKFCFDLLALGKPFYIPQFIPEAIDLMKIYRNCGGLAVLAHPGSNLKESENFIIDDLLAHGLSGIEVYTSHHNVWKEEFYLNYCLDKKILYTCGSDFHGKYKPHVKLGEVKNNTPEVVTGLKALLRQGKQQNA